MKVEANTENNSDSCQDLQIEDEDEEITKNNNTHRGLEVEDDGGRRGADVSPGFSKLL